jgi:hypothetical protein
MGRIWGTQDAHAPVPSFWVDEQDSLDGLDSLDQTWAQRLKGSVASEALTARRRWFGSGGEAIESTCRGSSGSIGSTLVAGATTRQGATVAC